MKLSRIVSAAALAAFVALPFAARAQSAPPVPQVPGQVMPQRHHHGNRFMRALHSLNVSDAQKQQIAGFVKDTRAANKGADPATRKANNQKLHAQIEGVLTPEQRTQLQAQLQHRRAGVPLPVPSPTR